MKRETEKSTEQRMQDSRDEKRRLEKQNFIASIIFAIIGLAAVIATLLMSKNMAITQIIEGVTP